MSNRREGRRFRILSLGSVTKSTQGLLHMPYYDGGDPPFITDFRF